MMRWKKTTYKDGSYKLAKGNVYFYVHKGMGWYWIDYGRIDGHSKGTARVKLKSSVNKVIKRIFWK